MIELKIVLALEPSLMAMLVASASGAAAPLAPPAPSTPIPSPTAPSALTTDAAAGQPAPTDGPAPSNGPAELDAAGVAWDPAKHASTKGVTGAGLWRMKVGVSRPAGEDKPLAAAAPPPPPPVAAAAAPAAEDDEFAQFRAAASAAAPVTAAARTWTDADLSKLCNQAALAAGSPDKVKEVIAKYVPANDVPHSRNVPADQREAFASEVEAATGIQYAA